MVLLQHHVYMFDYDDDDDDDVDDDGYDEYDNGDVGLRDPGFSRSSNADSPFTLSFVSVGVLICAAK